MSSTRPHGPRPGPRNSYLDNNNNNSSGSPSTGLSAEDEKRVQDIERKISREQVIIKGAKAVSQKTDNPFVQVRSQQTVRESEKNIKYLSESLHQLQIRRSSQVTLTDNDSANNDNSTTADMNDSSSIYTTLDPRRNPSGKVDMDNNSISSNENTSFDDRLTTTTSHSKDKPLPHPIDTNTTTTKKLGPSPYFKVDNQPGLPLPTKPRPNYTKLDLLKYDTPYLGPRIQLMLQQLEFKLSIEKQYKQGIEKMAKLYQLEGDRRSRADAESKRVESNQKILLLKQALKRYQAMHIDIDEEIEEDDNSINAPNIRRPLSGLLRIGIVAIRNAEHAVTVSRFSRLPDSFVSVKVEDQLRARTRYSKTDRWNEEFNIEVDKANEIEITVYDRSGSGDQSIPIGIMWLRISDIAEELRRRKLKMELAASGWVSADTMQQKAVHGNLSGNGGGGTSPLAGDNNNNNNNSTDGSTTTTSLTNNSLLTPQGATTTAVTASPSENNNINNNNNKTSEFVGTSQVPQRPGTINNNILDTSINAWFELEASGQIQLSIDFIKQATGHRPYESHGLGRQGAIRQRKIDIHEMHGHKFIQQQFYNIMRCAYCGDFLKYSAGFQCQDCKYTCHKRCYQKVVTKCISKSSSDTDPDEERLNHRIPHRFEPFTNLGANWCCHCGYMLPLGKKNNRKCTDCGLTSHSQCVHLVPDFCGMSMEMANQILSEIKTTKIRQAQNNIVANRAVAKQHKKYSVPAAAAAPLPPPPPTGAPPPVPAKQQQLSPNGAAAAAAAARFHKEPVKRKEVGTGVTGPPPPLPFRKSVSKSMLVDEEAPLPPTPPKTAAPAAAPPLVPSTKEAKRASVQQQLFHHQQQRSEAAASISSPETSAPTTPSKGNSMPQLAIDTLDDTSNNRLIPSKSRETIGKQLDQHSRLTKVVTAPVKESQSPVVVAKTPVSIRSDVGKVTTSTTTAAITKKIGLENFNLLAVLGKGNFGKVLLAESKATSKLYAIKVLKKEFIIENDEVDSTKSEKRVFLVANKERHPFLLNLHSCFQTESRVYFVMEYISGGDLMLHIQKEQFTPRRAQFYAAEVLLGLKYFHENGVIYRDLKLDNILLTLDGHIKIADYGLCKEDMWHGCTTGTFCGTPEFMAPEILMEQKYGRGVDWWAFGVLIYQMLLGQSPFRGDDEDEIFDAILADEVLYPVLMPQNSVSILQQLLTRDPEKRLGSSKNDAIDVMNHKYFSNINFDDIYNGKIIPPFIPSINSPTDTKNFDSEFTKEDPVLTPVNCDLTSVMQEQFRGFSYYSQNVL